MFGLGAGRISSAVPYFTHIMFVMYAFGLRGCIRWLFVSKQILLYERIVNASAYPQNDFHLSCVIKNMQHIQKLTKNAMASYTSCLHEFLDGIQDENFGIYSTFRKFCPFPRPL